VSEHSLEVAGLTLGYDGADIVSELSTDIPAGAITAIIGANASGKSTLLRGISRLLAPRAGQVLLDGVPVHSMRSGDLARLVGLLPQSPVAPSSITVGDLVGRGRYPHQGWFRRWTPDDDAAVDEALEATGTADLVSRRVADLSGGQRQRVWIAMALAQDTDILLLDEPTTFLDVNYQIEVLDLLVDLNRDRGKTVVMVLHELSLACRYADHLIAMKNGRIVTEGTPGEVVTAAIVEEVFSLPCDVISDPRSGTPLVIPLGRHRIGSVRTAGGRVDEP
jgi:iron complex transport system ATP-binding protein